MYSRTNIWGNAPILQEYVEAKLGKVNDQPQLTAAIDYAKWKGAALSIAKLNRLSRNAGFIFAQRDNMG